MRTSKEYKSLEGRGVDKETHLQLRNKPQDTTLLKNKIDLHVHHLKYFDTLPDFFILNWEKLFK